MANKINKCITSEMTLQKKKSGPDSQWNLRHSVSTQCSITTLHNHAQHVSSAFETAPKFVLQCSLFFPIFEFFGLRRTLYLYFRHAYMQFLGRPRVCWAVKLAGHESALQATTSYRRCQGRPLVASRPVGRVTGAARQERVGDFF